MVYFRNVDWRCKRLHEMHRTHEVLTDEAGAPIYVDSINRLRYELMKLEADLEALSLLVGIWERRIADIPLWYPYSGLFREMLEAQVELQASLLRHTGPLRFLLDELAEGRPSGDAFAQDRNYCWSYFHGEADRMWAASTLKSCRSGSQTNGRMSFCSLVVCQSKGRERAQCRPLPELVAHEIPAYLTNAENCPQGFCGHAVIYVTCRGMAKRGASLHSI